MPEGPVPLFVNTRRDDRVQLSLATKTEGELYGLRKAEKVGAPAGGTIAPTYLPPHYIWPQQRRKQEQRALSSI